MLTPVQSRLIHKLPTTATSGKLTRPEVSQLAPLERLGFIRYIDQSGYWVHTDKCPKCGENCGYWNLPLCCGK